eukprot:g5848.t1
MFCHEFANVLENTLSAPGLADVMSVSIIPTPYPVYPNNNSLQCHDPTVSPPFDYDCRGAKWEACVVAETCGPPGTDCGRHVQRRLATFFKCFEGPFANQDGPTDFSVRASCAGRAGLDVAAITSCYKSIEDATTVDNPVQSPFWKASQQVLSFGFPYVRINDGSTAANWPDLLSIVCDLQGHLQGDLQGLQGGGTDGASNSSGAPAGKPRIPKGCEVDRGAHGPMTVDLLGPGLAIDTFSAALYRQALVQATNFIISNVTFPVRFAGGGNPGTPSYLEMNVTRSVEVHSITDISKGGEGGALRVVAETGVLRATSGALGRGRRSGEGRNTFEQFIAQALGVVNITVDTVRIR